MSKDWFVVLFIFGFAIPDFHLVTEGKFEETDRGFVFRRMRGFKVQGFIELERGELNGTTYVNLVYYRVWPLWIERSESIDETARLTVLYLRDLLSRQPTPITTTDATNEHCNHVIGLVMDEMMGALSRTQEVSMGKWFALSISGLLWIASGVALFMLWPLTEGFHLIELVSVVGAALYATFETRQYFKES